MIPLDYSILNADVKYISYHEPSVYDTNEYILKNIYFDENKKIIKFKKNINSINIFIVMKKI